MSADHHLSNSGHLLPTISNTSCRQDEFAKTRRRAVRLIQTELPRAQSRFGGIVGRAKPKHDLLERCSAGPHDESKVWNHPPVLMTFKNILDQSTTRSAFQETNQCIADRGIINRPFGDQEDIKDQDTTPRGSNEAWRFTPSMLDTNSFTFASFANQPHGYYTPTPGGTNTLYHNQAGDLHTPGMGIHLGTPLSMPMSETQLHAGTSLDMHGFHPHMLQSHAFQHSNPFATQQTYAPSSFVHQDSGCYEAMDASNDGSPGNDVSMEPEMQRDSNPTALSSRHFEGVMAAPPLPTNDK